MAARSLGKDHNLITLICVVLVLIIGIIGVKYMWAKVRWSNYAEKMQTRPMQYGSQDSAADAATLGMTIMTVPAGNPLYRQPKGLQTYVEALSKQTGRDIVIVDKDKMIIADTIPANVGTTYTFDTGDEIKKAMNDEQWHSFVETSTDYSAGISQTAIPLKDTKGSVVGAIIMSSSPIFK